MAGGLVMRVVLDKDSPMTLVEVEGGLMGALWAIGSNVENRLARMVVTELLVGVRKDLKGSGDEA